MRRVLIAFATFLVVGCWSSPLGSACVVGQAKGSTSILLQLLTCADCFTVWKYLSGSPILYLRIILRQRKREACWRRAIQPLHCCYPLTNGIQMTSSANMLVVATQLRASGCHLFLSTYFYVPLLPLEFLRKQDSSESEGIFSYNQRHGHYRRTVEQT